MGQDASGFPRYQPNFLYSSRFASPLNRSIVAGALIVVPATIEACAGPVMVGPPRAGAMIKAGTGTSRVG